MYKVMRQFEASFAHTLKDHKGKCKRLHGHNYMIEIEFSSPFLGESLYPNMLMDFGDIKEIYKNRIEDLYDHRDSTYIYDDLGDYPTAESMAYHIYSIAREELEKIKEKQNIYQNTYVSRVRVWETRDTYAEYIPD